MSSSSSSGGFAKLPVPLKLSINDTAPNYWFLVETSHVIKLIESISRFYELTKAGKDRAPQTVEALGVQLESVDRFWTAQLGELIEPGTSLQRVAATINMLVDVMQLSENRKAIDSDMRAILDGFEEVKRNQTVISQARRQGVAKAVVKVIDAINALVTKTLDMLKEPIKVAMKPYFIDYIVALGRCMCYAVAGNATDAATQHSRFVIAAISVVREMDVQVSIVVSKRRSGSASASSSTRSRSGSGGSGGGSGRMGVIPGAVKYEVLPPNPTPRGYGMVPQDSADKFEFSEARKGSNSGNAADQLQREAEKFLKLARKIPGSSAQRLALFLPPQFDVDLLKAGDTTADRVLYHLYDDEEFQQWKKQCPEVFAPKAPQGSIRSIIGPRLKLLCKTGYTADDKAGLFFLDDLVIVKGSNDGELITVKGIKQPIVVYRIKRMLSRY